MAVMTTKKVSTKTATPQQGEFDYRLALAQELKVRQARNSRYSLRSFARDLNVSVTALSDVLSGKRSFSHKNAEKVIQKLGWSPVQSQIFLADLAHSERPTPQKIAEMQLQDDQFHFISEWYYFVILNLAKI